MNKDKNKTANTDVNDSDLVESFKEGNNVAFERLVAKYQDRIFNTCYRFLGNMQEAEDVAQDVFIKVFKGLKRFRSESSFYTWIYRIAVNTCKNRVKSLDYRRLKKKKELTEENYTADSKAAAVVGSNNDPAEFFEKKERMKQIQNAIKKLPSDQRAVVVLRDIEGFSYDEISEITGHKLGTVKSKLSRARNELRNRLMRIM